MKPSETQAFRIHEYEIVPNDGIIRGPDGVSRVPEHAMDLLLRLAARPGETLEPAALGEDGQAPPSTETLAARIREVRGYLGGGADSHRLIEPAGDAGYRLVAPVTAAPTSWLHELRQKRVFRAVASYGVSAWLLLQIVDVVSGALPVPDWTMSAAAVAVACGFPLAAIIAWTFQITPDGVVLDVGNAPRRRVTLRSVARQFDIFVIAALVGLVVFLSYGRVFATAAPDERFAVAVLPFENLSSDPSDGYLSEGIAGDIRNRLLGVPQLLVAAGRSSRELSTQGLDIREIGSRLNVEHILEGSVRRSGDVIRVSVQLVDVASGFNRWSQNYDTDIDSLLELENDIALVVASELELLLSPDLRTIVADAPTEDSVAHGLYLQARDYFNRPRTDDNLLQAQRRFEDAIAQDPRFALAHAGLCQTLVERFEQFGDTALIDEAEQQCPRALALDDDVSPVHTALGDLYLATGRLDEAAREYEAAIALNTRALDAQTGLANALARLGRIDEAQAQYEIAIDMLPGNWLGYAGYAHFLLTQGRLEAAIEQYERVIELAPGSANAYNNMGVAYYFLGDFEAARDHYAKSTSIDPNRAAYSNTGTMHYYLGEYEHAAALFRLAASEADKDYRLWGNLADAQRFIEAERDASASSYERAVELALARLAVDGEDRDALTNLAWYYANLGRNVAARDSLSKALALGEPSADQHYLRAITLALLGDDDAARDAIQTALGAGALAAMIDATPEFRERGLFTNNR